MPSLRFRKDGQPFLVTSYREGDGSSGFTTWYPDNHAMDEFQANGIEAGGYVDWEQFHELRDEGHIVRGRDGEPGRNPHELESFRSLDAEVQEFFQHLHEEAEPDYENLGNLFREFLRQILRIEDLEVRSSQFYSVADSINDLLNLTEQEQEKREFGLSCRNRLIGRVPDRLCERLKKFFRIDEASWDQIRNLRHIPDIQPEAPAEESPTDSFYSGGIASRSGSLDQLNELLRFAYEQNLIHGMEVEIEIRAWPKE